MTNLHYYSEDQEELESNPSTFNFNFKNNSFIFTTDNGVFSKKYIDYGSFVMLSTYIPNDINLPILDMGAGYGAIGLVLAKLYQNEVYMAEINTRAYNLIIKNAKDNHIDNVKIFHSDLYNMLPKDIKFSSIVTNPPIRAGKDVVYKIYDEAINYLEVGGALWVVIQKKQGAPSSIKHLEEVFGNCNIVKKDKGYYILKCIKQN